MTHLLHIFSVARTLRFLSVVSWVVLSAACTAVNAPDNSSLLLKTAGGFQVGGEIVPVGATSVEGSKSGTVWANQLSVLYMVPAVSGGRKPVVLLPEFGLARDIFLETPDGREGWAMELLRAGYPVYLVEPAQSSRAGVNPERFNASAEQRSGGWGRLFSWTREHGWVTFGLGSEFSEAPEESLFPVQRYEDLARLYTPTWVGNLGDGDVVFEPVGANVAGLSELLARIGPSHLLVHMSAAATGLELADKAPAELLSLMLVDPSHCRGREVDSPQLRVSVWGANPAPSCRNLAATAEGWIREEPESRLIMLQRNSSLWITEIIGWLEAGRTDQAD